MNRPRWRWWLWCVAFELDMMGLTPFRRLWHWCILPKWLAAEEELAAHVKSDRATNVPF